MKHTFRLLLAASVLSVAACSDARAPVAPGDEASLSRSARAPQDAAAWFASAAPEVMALPRTVFAAADAATNQIVFGVENPAAMNGVRNVMAARGIPASAYRIEVSEPIHFASTTLRTAHRPTQGGIQIHFSNFLCTLGFNVDHAGGRSFITNSHCTDNQGTTGNTTYYQPTSSISPAAIGVEADDPAYTRGGGCSVGKVCRFSDAARVLYNSTGSTRGAIARTTGVNNGSIDIGGTFSVTSQNNTATSYSGTIHKVGRTTGWTSGNVTSTCATVNVSGSNIQLRCQTLVQRSGTQIVGGGDSGSPVFIPSGDNVTLVGILWGGSSSGDLFVFSPLKNIQDELGALDATAGGSGPAPDDPPPDEEPPPPPCTPRGNSGVCR